MDIDTSPGIARGGRPCAARDAGRLRELAFLRVLLEEHRGRYRTQLRLLDQPRPQQHDAGTVDQSTLAAVTWRRLDDVDRALRALELGGYGVCTGCGNDIPIDHLMRHPAADRCPACIGDARPPAPSDHRHRAIRHERYPAIRPDTPTQR
ncbi:TraR/DksA family transcriptional regulator [Dactylosporangium sucinum]|uniref:DksA C4-type domain-containing protein n=1 Tax=Dactylosporangium sucinum TaxID=1424081 RepID=A0A917U767_9ACTN|nr:hypothetical protein [Dactylosporangium sucinum]GGM63114.1 hypothetical protein GCM10007977_075870 [Dactylosporangium sucinum]